MTLEHTLEKNTVDYLNKLTNVTWFSNVGKSDTGNITVQDWVEAEEHCLSDNWEDVQLEARNDLSELAANYSDIKNWNDISAKLKTIIEPLVDEKTQIFNSCLVRPELVRNSIRWDITLCAVAFEYQRFISFPLYDDIAQIYLRGHFPCGWLGEWPEGQLIIF